MLFALDIKQRTAMQTDPKTLLRDVMSTERTSLANKRTFMAAIRTALALAATGAAFIKFLDDDFIKVLGWLLIAGGLLVQVIGSINYFRVRQVVLHARHTVDPNNELPDHIESSKKQRRGK